MRPGPLRVGQDFGPRYHVVKLLGSGGMGVVYQALDRDLGVEIALKVLRAPAPGPKAAHSVAELQRRFRTELLLARKVTHKNVIRIHDIGEINGIRFISMPLVTGPDLGTLLAHGPLPVARVVRYARQIVAGLVAVHAAGVVHRDLKPSNVMIAEDDQAILMDFGIARSNAPAGQPRTIAGAVIGTMAYMAPEQARGEAVDERTDIYAFGLILYEMLSGPRPNLTLADLVARMKAPPAAARQLNPAVPAALDAIVTRCLQPAATERYQRSIELAAALAGMSRRRGGAGGMRGIGRQWLRRAAAALVVLACGAFVYWSTTPAGTMARMRAKTLASASLTSLGASRLVASTISQRPPAPAARAPQAVLARATAARHDDRGSGWLALPGLTLPRLPWPAVATLRDWNAGPGAGEWTVYSRVTWLLASPHAATALSSADEFQVCYAPDPAATE